MSQQVFWRWRYTGVRVNGARHHADLYIVYTPFEYPSCWPMFQNKERLNHKNLKKHFYDKKTSEFIQKLQPQRWRSEPMSDMHRLAVDHSRHLGWYYLEILSAMFCFDLINWLAPSLVMAWAGLQNEKLPLKADDAKNTFVLCRKLYKVLAAVDT